MRLDVELNDKEVLKRLARLSKRGPDVAKKAVSSLANMFIAFMTRKRLSGRVGNKGLFRRTGALARSLIQRTTGTRISDVESKVGFLDSKSARIARVHEFGTVGAGGILPDIVPRTKKWLRWPVRSGTAALSSSVEGYAYAKSVAIPPRLEFFPTFHSPELQRRFQDRLDEAAEEWLR